jgi:hypothetical protein
MATGLAELDLTVTPAGQPGRPARISATETLATQEEQR